MEAHDPRDRLIRSAIDSMIRTARLHHNVVDRATESDTLPRAQRRLLMHLCLFGHVASQRRLSEELEVTPACVARMLKSLTSEGYILRTEDETDSRRNSVSVTEKGRRVVSETCQIFDGLDRAGFEGFTDAEIERLSGLLQRVHENLRAIDSVGR